MTARKLRLEDLRGKAVFLNFWASWCSPAAPKPRISKPPGKRSKTRTWSFSASPCRTRDQRPKNFLKEFNVTYPNGRDESGKIAVDYGTWGIPESFFIDPQGRITYKHVGGIRAALVIDQT